MPSQCLLRLSSEEWIGARFRHAKIVWITCLFKRVNEPLIMQADASEEKTNEKGGVKFGEC